MGRISTGSWGFTGKLQVGGNPSEVSTQVAFENDETDKHVGKPNPAEIYTVQFEIRPDFAVDSLINDTFIHPNAIAEVTFAAGGNQLQRVLAIGDGCSISGAADHIKVKIIDQTTVPAGVSTAGKTYSVSVLITKGTRNSIHSRVIPIPGPITLAPGASLTDIPVLLEAGIVAIQFSATNLSGGGVSWASVECRDVFENVLATLSADPAFVPLPPTTQKIRYINNGPPGSGNILFQGNFGIDG